MTKVKVYGRAGCHLCEQMAGLLRAFNIAFEHIDVDADPALAERYGERVPVLTDAAGNELCHGRLDPAVLERVR